MIKLRLILLFFTASICFSSVAQTKTQKLELAGKYKKQPKFNSDDVSVIAMLRPNENGYNVSLTISSKVPGKYNLYVFDSDLTKDNSYGWTDTHLIYKWLRDLSIIPELGLGRKVDLDFNGKFIEFDEGALTRDSWERDGGYKILKDIIPDFDNIRANENGGNYTIAYKFLVTENAKNDELLVGTTQPFSLELPSSSVQVSATESPKVVVSKAEEIKQPVVEEELPAVVSEEVELAPDQNLAETWDKKVKEDLLKPFRSKGINSYASLTQNSTLYDLYEKEAYDQKIRKALADIEKELADAKYAAKRTELRIILKSFIQTENNTQPIAKSTVKTITEAETEDVEKATVAEPVINENAEADVKEGKEYDNTGEEKKAIKPTPIKSSVGDDCIDSVSYYYRKVEDLYFYITGNNKLSTTEKEALKNRFLVYSGSFNGFADGCTNSRTQTFKSEFNRMVKAINRAIDAVSEENLPIATEGAPPVNNDDKALDDWQDDTVEIYQTGQTLFLYIVVGFIILMLLGVLIYLVRKQK